MVFHKKSYTFDVLFNNKDEMLDLKQLTAEVCRIATEAGHFLKEERKNFRRERVMEKHAHDYVSYVDKESEVRLVKALSALLPEAGFITEEGSATYQDEPYAGSLIHWTELRIIFMMRLLIVYASLCAVVPNCFWELCMKSAGMNVSMPGKRGRLS